MTQRKMPSQISSDPLPPRRRLAHLASIILLITAACGGGSSGGGGGGVGTINGLVTKGPVDGATITAYSLDDQLVRKTVIATGQSQSDGTFTLEITPYNGPIEIIATGGTYVDEVRLTPGGDPAALQLSTSLSTILPAFQAGTTVEATLTPVSTLATALSRATVATKGLQVAVSDAWSCVNQHFGGVDWRTVKPLNFAVTRGTTVTATMSEAPTKAGLVLAGFSQLAATLSPPPATSVTGITLAENLAKDASDGVLDGQLNGALLRSGTGSAPYLSAYTARNDLGQAILDFLGTPANPTALRPVDVYTLVGQMAGNETRCLFSEAHPSTLDTSAPAPVIATGTAGSYFAEDQMHLTSATSPVYRFTDGTQKAAITAGSSVYKATTRLAAPAGLTTAQLEVQDGTNTGNTGMNVPFIRISIPRGAAAPPLSSATVHVTTISSQDSIDLLAWRAAPNVYYLPLVSRIGDTPFLPWLATTPASPVELTIEVEATDALGQTSGRVSLGTISFHIIGPPLYVAEDITYPSSNNPASTYPYRVANQTFHELWNSANPAFADGTVRLLRYTITNPHPQRVAFTGALWNGTWGSAETWTRFLHTLSTLPVPASVGPGVTVDGRTYQDLYCACRGSSCSSCSEVPAACKTWWPPCGAPSWDTVFGHVIGASNEGYPGYYCGAPSPRSGDYSGAEGPITLDAAASGDIRLGFFQTNGSASNEPAATATDTTHTYFVIDPGQTLVLYVARPVNIARTFFPTWNAVTQNGNRYETYIEFSYNRPVLVYGLSSCHSADLYFFRRDAAAAYLGDINEYLRGTLTLATRGLVDATPVGGERAAMFSASLDRTVSTH